MPGSGAATCNSGHYSNGRNPGRSCRRGSVTLPCEEREASASQELSGRCDCGPPGGHRRSAKRAVRLGGGEMALDVEGIVDGCMG